MSTNVKNFFISPEAIFDRMSILYKRVEFDRLAVIELCADCMVNVIKDSSTMALFEDIGITMTNNMVKLPCNVFRILDVFDEDENQLEFKTNGDYLYDIIDESGDAIEDGTIVYLNYRGIPVDEDGMIVIPEWFQIPCETYCKIKLLEEDVGYGKFDKDLWMLWNTQIPGQIVAARNNFRLSSRKSIDDLNLIKYNMLQKIGDLPIIQRMKR